MTTDKLRVNMTAEDFWRMTQEAGGKWAENKWEWWACEDGREVVMRAADVDETLNRYRQTSVKVWTRKGPAPETSVSV